MAGLEGTLRNAVPGGGIGKPLMLALLALLASGALFGRRDPAPAAPAGAQPTSDQGAGGLLGGLWGLMDKLQLPARPSRPPRLLRRAQQLRPALLPPARQ